MAHLEPTPFSRLRTNPQQTSDGPLFAVCTKKRCMYLIPWRLRWGLQAGGPKVNVENADVLALSLKWTTSSIYCRVMFLILQVCITVLLVLAVLPMISREPSDLSDMQSVLHLDLEFTTGTLVPISVPHFLSKGFRLFFFSLCLCQDVFL